jgi:hypothetical protein
MSSRQLTEAIFLKNIYISRHLLDKIFFHQGRWPKRFINALNNLGAMDQKAVSAVATSIEEARRIQMHNPEIKDMYTQGDTYRKISNYLSGRGYVHKYLIKAVHYAICGYDNHNGLKIKPFNGLISDKNYLASLASRHKENGARKLQKEGKGIYSLTPEERKFCSKMGNAALAEKLEKGLVIIGTAALSLEDRMRISMAGVKGRGDVPWTDLVLEDLGISAHEYALILSKMPNFVYESGGNKGTVKWTAIADEMTRVFGYKFTRHSVYTKIHKIGRNSL